ncbi:MAG: di-heme oxidoredictase family protein, partial [Dongiaceae bacterium]
CADPSHCIGRFGWKAAAATIDDQNALAFSLDIGMSTPRQPAPWGDCTPKESDCVKAPHGAGAAAGETEIAPQLLALVDAFVRAEPAPTRHDSDSALAKAGATVFADIGCAACHRPRYTIAAADGGSQIISPYSDLLLHDLGDGLRDAAGPAGEWRTAPLWGIGTIDRAAGPKAYLHDGRARSLEEAILWHGGEATHAAAAAKALTTAEWNALLVFLRSL